MKFTEVAPMMEREQKIKLKQWKNAYWYLDNKGCLINHFEEGEEIPAADLFPYTLAWGLCNDWEVVQESKVEKIHSFGYALSALKNGKKVARRGWNGKGMFLVLCPGNTVPADHMKVKEVKKFYQNEKQDTVTINPHIDMKAADGTYVTGWIASQTDMLADDWYVVE